MKDQNYFKEKLFNHTAQVPDELWQKIESQLPANKKRFPFFWFTLAVGTVLTAAMIMWYPTRNEKTTPEKPTIEEKTDTGATAVSFPSDNQSIIGTNALSSETSTSTNASSNTTPSNSANSTSSSTNTISIDNSNSSGSNSPSLSKRNVDKAYKPKNNRTLPSLSGNAHGGSASGNEDPTASSTYDAVNESSSISLRSEINIHTLQSSEISIITDEEDLITISGIRPDPSCYKFTGESTISPLSLDVFGGPGISPRSFQDAAGELAFYKEARETTEARQYAFSVGARVNYNLKQGYALRVGVLYQQNGDLFDYTDSLATQTTTRVDSFFAADGTFLYADTSRGLILGTLIKKIHNRYTHIDVPLIFSYELPLGRSTIMLNAGPVINLTSSYKGQMLDPGLVPRHFTSGEQNAIKVYKNNLCLSLYLGAGLLLPINEHISALIEPRFLYRINPVTLDGYPLEEHRHYAGLNVGLRYHFHH